MNKITNLFNNYSWYEEKNTDDHKIFVKNNREFSIKTNDIYVFISYPLYGSKYNHEIKMLNSNHEEVYNIIKKKIEYFEFCNENY